MNYDKTWSRYGRHIHRLKIIQTLVSLFILFLVVVVAILIIPRFKNSSTNEKKEILQVWSAGNFEQAYEISKNALIADSMDYFLLTINGFSAYQLGISQINSFNTLVYINECICSLRKALLLKESSKDGRVFYVLGKAYCYKGNEYADLAVKFLEMANNLSYDAHDIPEYLGLAYAACGDYQNSVEAFSRAFIPSRQPSDSLLISIARSYMAMGEFNTAAGYLMLCIESSPDSRSIISARFLLADVYRTSGDHEGAENQYLAILKDSGENAEVHYQLGEMYNQKGDTTRARYEWRIARNQDPAHAKARARLN